MEAMDQIPIELHEAVLAGDLIPVVGDALCLTTGRQDLADALLVRLGKPRGLPGPADERLLASEYEAIRGRSSLLDLIIKLNGNPAPPVSDCLQVIAQLTDEAIITTNVGHAAKVALEQAGRLSYSLISNPLDTSFATADRRPWLIKLCGCVNRPDSLLVSQDDLISLSTSIDHLSVLVRSILLTKTLLFVDYRLDDPILETVHTMLQTSTTHSRRRYILVGKGKNDSARAAIWTRRGYDVIEMNPELAVRSLLENSRPRGRSLRSQSPGRVAGDSPFKFLDYFTEEDHERFFGRTEEADLLTSTVAASSFTLVVGQSGVGKTSLVNAGLVPRLHAQGYNTYSIRALEHPTVEILSAISDGPVAADAALGTNLRWALRQQLDLRPVVIVIDQFEEFFIRVGHESRATFAEQLHECLTSADINLRVVVVIREDFLHHLLELDPPIEQIFKNRYWVRRLTLSQAAEALAATCAYYSVTLEPGFLSLLLADLNSEGVDPAQLQIVCHEVFRKSAENRALSLENYQNLGRTDGILAEYLNATLSDMSADDRRAAEGVLKCMVSAEQTKAAMSTREIASDAITRRLAISPALVDSILRALVARRVVRPVPGRQDYYELSHDFMVRSIWEWIEPAEVELKYARQVLQQCVADWRHLHILPNDTQWAVIERLADEVELQEAEARLALRAALTRDMDAPWWLRKATEAGLDTWGELADILTSGAPEARHSILRWLDESPDLDARHQRLLQLALSSDYPAVVIRARRVAERLPESRRLLAIGAESSKFVLIPGGEFVFGVDDPRFESSQPAYSAYVSSFYIARFPVTNYEYSIFVSATGSRAPDHWRGPRPPSAITEHPVVQVNWYEAVTYCKWYAQANSLPVRLPTAAEWEKAASWDPAGRKKNLWSWGDEYDPAKGNSRPGSPGHTTPIGQYSPTGGDSAYGVSDMCGNTFDWTQDFWAPEHDPTDLTNPTGPASGEHKSARGGSWSGSAIGASAVSNKYSLAPVTRNEYTGFRLAYSTTDLQREKRQT